MILIREEYENETTNTRFGDSGEPYEPFTDDLGKLFKSLRSEYGRAQSKVYVDLNSGGVRHVGWAFVKRMKYEDARTDKPSDYYTRCVWVTLYESCEVDDPSATISTSRNGAVTRHPFKQLDIEAYRKAQRRAA